MDLVSPGPGVEAHDGFDEFFRSEAHAQVRRAALLLGSEAEANDVVQEALVRVLQRWRTLDHPGPYLNRVVLNLCRDRSRRVTVWHRLAPLFAPTSQAAISDAGVLDDVLLSLPYNQRAAVVLRFWGGHSNEEIAEQLGCSTGSVGPWIDRALTRLRKELE